MSASREHALRLLEKARGDRHVAATNAEDLALLTPFAAAWRYDDPLQESAGFESGWLLERVAETVSWAESMLGEE